MTPREPLLSASYFDSKIEYLEKSMTDRLRKLQDQPTVYTKRKFFSTRISATVIN